MARQHLVKKSRKEVTCGSCREQLPVASEYRWVQIKTSKYSSRRMNRCMQFKCRFRPSQLTSSKRGEVYAIQEGYDTWKQPLASRRLSLCAA